MPNAPADRFAGPAPVGDGASRSDANRTSFGPSIHALHAALKSPKALAGRRQYLPI
jgi:hypothetical protein